MNPETGGLDGENRTRSRIVFTKRKSPNKTKGAWLLLALFLLGGGAVSWFFMQKAASNLAGDGRPTRAAADDYSPSAFGAAGGPASSGREEPLASAADGSQGNAGMTPVHSVPGAGPSAPTAAYKPGGDAYNSFGAPNGKRAAGGPAGSGAVAGRYGRAAAFGGPASVKRSSGAVKMEGFAAEGDKLTVAGASDAGMQAGGSPRAAKSSVLEALKGAFRTNLIGARLASQDAAKTWMAKTFEGNRDSRHSLQYSENVKAHLDRLNPNSIPGFLRDQNLNETSARSLGVSKVQMPSFDRQGTQEALAADRDYQQKKMTQEIISAMFKPMGPFDQGERNAAELKAASGLDGNKEGARSMGTMGLESWDTEVGEPANTRSDATSFGGLFNGDSGGSNGSGGGGGGGGSGAADSSEGRPKASVYQLPPEDKQTLQTDAAKELATTPSVDYGASCGCTIDAPCCCLPPGYLENANKAKTVGVGSAAGLGLDFPKK